MAENLATMLTNITSVVTEAFDWVTLAGGAILESPILSLSPVPSLLSAWAWLCFAAWQVTCKQYAGVSYGIDRSRQR